MALADLTWVVYDGEDIHGAALVTLTKDDVIEAAYRHALRGTGSGTITLAVDHTAVTSGFMVRGNYVRVRDTALNEVIGGFFLDEGEVVLLSDKKGAKGAARRGKGYKIGGPSTLAYLARAHLDDVARSPSQGPFSQYWIDTTGNWHWGSAGGEDYGDIIRRVIVEAGLQTPNPIPAIQEGGNNYATSVVDSSSQFFTGTYEQPVGSSLLDIVMDLVRRGIDIHIDPDTFNILTVDAGGLGTDRTSATFAAGKVRFEAAVNIASDLRRAIHHSNYVSHMVVTSTTGDVDSFVVADPDWVSGDPVRGGWFRLEGDDTTDLQTAALADIEARKRETDQAVVPHRYGDVEAQGRYTPSDRNGTGHYAPGDLVTLHTGTGSEDYNNHAIEVAAVNWRMTENGLFQPVAELGSEYVSRSDAAFDDRIAGILEPKCNCPKPCSPDFSYIESDSTWKTMQLGAEPDGWKQPGFDDSDWNQAVDTGFPVAGLTIGVKPPTYVPGSSNLYRREYWIDEADLTGASVVFKYALDNAGTIYVNGVQVAQLTGTGASNYEDDHETTLADSVFQPGLNCVAVETTDDGMIATKAGVYIEVVTGNLSGRSIRYARCDHGHRHVDLSGRDVPQQHPASAVTYDNTISELVAGDVQEAIDELATQTGDQWNPPVTAALSNPPTEAELEAAIDDSPANRAGEVWTVTDSDTGRPYLVASDGVRLPFVPLIVPSGASAPPSGSGILEINAPAGGGYGAGSAEHHGSYTYAAFVRGTDGDIRVLAMPDSDPTAKQGRLIFDNLEADLHATPSVLVHKPDNKLWVATSKHNGAAAYLWISNSSLDTDPTLANGFTQYNLDAQLGGEQYTYLRLFQLLDLTDDPTFLFYRPNPGGHPGHVGQKWAYSKTIASDGTGWSTGVEFYGGDDSGYCTPSKTSESRIDLSLTDDAPDAFGLNMSVYHAYFDGTDFYQTDGTLITATQPFDQTAATQVYDGTVDGVSTGPGSVVLGGDGHPRMIFHVLRAAQDIEVWWARWTGAAWDEHEVSDGQWGGGTNDKTRGGIDLDLDDPDRVYHTKRVAGQTELYVSTTADNGATWTPTAITTGSATKQMRPVPVRNAGSALKVIWSYGTFNNGGDYNMGTRGSTT